MNVDWHAAEPLIQQATDLDPGHAGARSMRTLIVDIKRKEFVSYCLAEARDLQAAGDPDGSLAKVEAGLGGYPNEGRLAQLQTTLKTSAREARRSKERAGDVEALRGIRQRVEQPGNSEELGSLIDQSAAILAKHPDDPEIGSLAAEIQHWASASAATRVIGPPRPPADSAATVILEPGAVKHSASAAVAGASASGAPLVEEKPRGDAKPSDTSTPTVKPAGAPVKEKDTAVKETAVKEEAKQPLSPAKGASPFRSAIILGVLVLAGAAIILDRKS